MTEGNAAAISDNSGSAVDAGAIGAVSVDDAVDAVVGIVGTASDDDVSVVSTYY